MRTSMGHGARRARAGVLTVVAAVVAVGAPLVACVDDSENPTPIDAGRADATTHDGGTPVDSGGRADTGETSDASDGGVATTRVKRATRATAA